MFAQLGALGALGSVEPGRVMISGADFQAAYTNYLRAVKAAGGLVTQYPYHGWLAPEAWSSIFAVFSDAHDTYGALCAKYPIAAANRFDSEPDQLEENPDGSTSAFYLAPSLLIKWQRDTGPGGMLDSDQMRTAGTDQTPADLKPVWYNNLLTGVKLAAVAGVALVALNIMAYVPKPRNWE